MNMWVKNDKGEMVPFPPSWKSKATKRNEINRYNMYNTAAIQGGPQRL